MKAYKKKLTNGLRVITVPMKETPTVTVLVMVAAGSKHENKQNNGISHFLEHMCFQGTANRPEPGEVSYELESIGAIHNAFTSQEYTGYFAKGQSKHTTKIIELIADLYLNPSFPKDAVKREKGVIVEEINMYEDLPQYKVMDLLMNLLYKDQPAGFDILGTKRNIKKMTREDLVDYRAAHYVPQSTVVVVAGDINSAKVGKEIDRYFSKIGGGKKQKITPTKEKQNKPELLVKYKETDQSHIAFGFRAFDMYDKNTKTLSLMSSVLGQGLSSRLHRKMRNELGMAYYTSSFTDLYRDHGYFGVRAGVGHKRTIEAVEVILEEVKNLKEEKISEKELKKAKDLLIGKMYLGLEASDDIAVYYGMRDVLDLDMETPKEKEKQIRKINADDVQNLAKKIFVNKNLNLSVIGPFRRNGGKEFKKILNI